MSLVRSDLRRVNLPSNFEPRFYQLPLLLALERGIKRALVVWHRRAGKDKTFASIMVGRCAERVGIHYYYLPTATMARKIIWDGIDGSGFKFLDHFPPEFIRHINNQEMKITTSNGSIFQLIGTDEYDRIVGTNPVTCLFSEFSLQNPKAWEYVRPILAENGGVGLFNGTPRGKNHLWNLFQLGCKNPNWFTEILSVDDTFAISQESIQEEREMGMTEQMIRQEFYCDFNAGESNSYFTIELKECYDDNRVGYFSYDPDYPVYTFWDLGMGNTRGSDSLCISFYQFIGNNIYLIDDYEGEGKRIKQYIDIVLAKPYRYGNHFAPHDSSNRNLQTGTDLITFCEQYNFRFERVSRAYNKISDIQSGRSIFFRLHINQDKCRRIIECLSCYHEKLDKHGIRTGKPDHDWSSDMSDTFLLMSRALKLNMIRDNNLSFLNRNKTIQTDIKYEVGFF